jgi:hypothetical protein
MHCNYLKAKDARRTTMRMILKLPTNGQRARYDESIGEPLETSERAEAPSP